MRNKRVIKLRNPRLRKIRNEFRKLWSAAESAEWRRLRTEMRKLCFDEGGDFLTANQMKVIGILKIYHSLQRTQQDLREDFKRSICMCYTCGRIDLDMYCNHPYRTWFCVDCIPKIITEYTNMQVKKALGTYYCDDDDDFGGSFL